MGREKFANNPVTTLSGAINGATSAVAVTDGSVFPSSYFRVLVGTEIMFCTSRSGNNLTVVRGSESSVAASHSSGDTITGIVTAGAMTAFQANILAACGIVPNDDSLSADDDNFDDESFTGWTAVAGSPALTSTTEKSHRFNVVVPNGTAAAQLYAWVKPKTAPGAGDYIQVGFHDDGLPAGFPLAGVLFADGATYGSGNQEAFWMSSTEDKLYIGRHTGYNTSTTNASTVRHTGFNKYIVNHLRLIWSSANTYHGDFSLDGISWIRAFSGSTSASFTPTHAGFFCTPWGSGGGGARQFSFTYFRYSW